MKPEEFNQMLSRLEAMEKHEKTGGSFWHWRKAFGTSSTRKEAKMDGTTKLGPFAGVDASTCGERPGKVNADFQDIGWALMHLRTGKKVFRKMWNGKGKWLRIQYPDLYSKMSRPYIYMHTADNLLVPWVASQSDLMECDWEIVKE